jgi:hypothetical protein
MGYEDMGAKVSRAQRNVEDVYDRVRKLATDVHDFAAKTKKRTRLNVKSGLKSTERTIRRIRKAA